MKHEFKRVAVLMGGWSSERGISLQSGDAVLQALQRSGVAAFAFDVTRKSVGRLDRNLTDCAFIALHGRGGEDGVIQGLLETLGIPFTGSGVLAAALCMNKEASKRIWRSRGIATPDFVVLNEPPDAARLSRHPGLPLALKPVSEGSSIGVSRVDEPRQLEAAWQKAHSLHGGVMAERWIAGEEYAVGFLNGKALAPIRLEPARAFYDYIAKYEDADTRYHCPCGLPQDEVERLKALCVDACGALGVAGWARADVMRDQQGAFHVLEVNAVPGLTGHSLVPMAAKAEGMSFERLVLDILQTAGSGGR